MQKFSQLVIKIKDDTESYASIDAKNIALVIVIK